MGKQIENSLRGINTVMYSQVLFHKFITEPNKSYYDQVSGFLKENNVSFNKKDKALFCGTTLCINQLSLLREILCLVQNGVKRGRVDLESKNFKDGMAVLKEKTIIEGDKSVTNYNYIKALRNVLAHNNELADESIAYDFQGFSGNYVVVKSDEAGLVLKLEMSDLHKVCELIFKAINKTIGLGIYARRLENAVIGGYFDVEDINRYINRVEGETVSDLELDEYQKRAFLNYLNSGVQVEDKLYIPFVKNNKRGDIRLVYPELIKQVFPEKSHPEDIAFHKCLLYFVNSMIAQDSTRKKDDILKQMEDKPELFNVFTTYLLNSHYAMFLMISNGMYTVLSDRNLEDIENLYIEFLGEQNARHVRNALQHGTYYYNHNLGIEIYDGGKKLKHITTLDLERSANATFEIVHSRCKDALKVDVEEK